MSNPSTSSKTYWSILKIFCNNKKIPLIPPMFIGNKLESYSKLKANHFNKCLLLSAHPLIMTGPWQVALTFTTNLRFLL